jgi:hypothetical protein
MDDKGAACLVAPIHLLGAQIANQHTTSGHRTRTHPLFRKLCLLGGAEDLTGLETLLLRNKSKVTQCDMHRFYTSSPMISLTRVLQALGRHSTLTKPGLHAVFLVATRRDCSGWHCVTLRVYRVLIW